MNLKPEQLEPHLRKQLAPVYFISGDDPLRVIEAADAVRAAARSQGYDEREVLTVQTGFDWNSLLSEAGNLSLFSQRRIIDLRLPGGKPGKEGAQVLRDFAEQLPEDTLLLITSGKLEKPARTSKWVQALDKAGVVLFVWPLKGAELTTWVRARMLQRGLEPTVEAVEMLTGLVEGNLLACAQEIDKLHLLNGAGPVDVADITAMVGDNARYDVFGLIDSALLGDAARCVRILHRLQAEAVAPPVVLWALSREIRPLVGMATAVAEGDPVAAILGRYHVWQNRKQIVGAALKRLSADDCKAMIRQCALVDRVCKGRAAGNAWDELLQLTLKLAGKNVLPETLEMEQAS
ncbi:MAG: DNA polymerase III subunit delta [Gammaproteobacteria bacterium]|nr:DNA polymerase III subunit delta [Gammaproteobacteria bacterium]